MYILVNPKLICLTKITLEKLRKYPFNQMEKMWADDDLFVISFCPRHMLPEDIKMAKENKFPMIYSMSGVKYYFKTTVADHLYRKIQNYVSIKINNYYENLEMTNAKQYKDTTAKTLDIGLIKRIRENKTVAKTKIFTVSQII